MELACWPVNLPPAEMKRACKSIRESMVTGHMVPAVHFAETSALQWVFIDYVMSHYGSRVRLDPPSATCHEQRKGGTSYDTCAVAKSCILHQFLDITKAGRNICLPRPRYHAKRIGYCADGEDAYGKTYHRVWRGKCNAIALHAATVNSRPCSSWAKNIAKGPRLRGE